MDRLIGKAHRKTVLVGVAEHGDATQAEFLCGADDTHGDLAAIGD